MKIVRGTTYFKLVFFGTALAGKTSILEWLFQNAIPEEVKLTQHMAQIKTSFGQTLLFDFVPIRISDNSVARIYTSTGQDYYKSGRAHILAGADGIFLVIDSQKSELEHNQELVEELREYLGQLEGLTEAEVVVFFNKRDLDDIHPVEYLTEKLGLSGWTGFPTCGITGENLVKGLATMLRKLDERAHTRGVEVA